MGIQEKLRNLKKDETIELEPSEVEELKNRFPWWIPAYGVDGIVRMAQLIGKETFDIKTVFTVPLHVGQNIEVPEGSKVTYYKPGHSVMDFPENWKSENRCHHGVWLADHCFECEKRDNHDTSERGKE